MRFKIVLFTVLGCVLLQSCNKKTAKPAAKFEVNYNVVISNKVLEPSIISGFFGHMTKMHKKSNSPKPSRTPILIFPFEDKEAIESVKYEANGKTFYNLKALASRGVLPKYKFIPNKFGFYQMDLGEGKFCILMAEGSKHAFYPGGLGILSTTMTDLMELNLSADH